MNNKYVICYKARNKSLVVLIAIYKTKKILLDEAALKKLFSIIFDNENYEYKTTLLYRDKLHGNIYKVRLNKREISEAFSVIKHNSFNFNGARIKFSELVIAQNKIKELTEEEFSLTDPALIYFIESMRAELITLGYYKFV